jgi:dTDP-4-dehydrorhamnose reductase
VNTILIIGKRGQLGTALQSSLAPLGRVVAVGRDELDLTNIEAIRATIRANSPTIIVNAAAYTAVDKAENESALAMQINAVAPGVIAEEAKHIGALLVHFSTDYVFDGTKISPYLESDAPHPLSIYGKSKLNGEQAIAAVSCRHLILRTSWLYGAGHINFVTTILRLAQERPELSVVNDQIGSPTWVRSLAQVTAELLHKTGASPDVKNLFHLSAEGAVSRYDLALKIIDLAQKSDGGKSWATILPTTTVEYPLPATRPLMAVLSKNKINQFYAVKIPHWETQLAEFLSERNNQAH